MGTQPIKAPSRVPAERIYLQYGSVPEELDWEEIQEIKFGNEEKVVADSVAMALGFSPQKALRRKQTSKSLQLETALTRAKFLTRFTEVI